MLGFEPRTSLVLDKASATELHPSLCFSFVGGKVGFYVVVVSFLCTVQNLGVWKVQRPWPPPVACWSRMGGAALCFRLSGRRSEGR